MFYILETIQCGNATARVKNYYPETDLLVLFDVYGELVQGSTVIGQSSGTVKTLNNFEISTDYDLYYDTYDWEDVYDRMLITDEGSVITPGFESHDEEFDFTFYSEAILAEEPGPVEVE